MIILYDFSCQGDIKCSKFLILYINIDIILKFDSTTTIRNISFMINHKYLIIGKNPRWEEFFSK